LIVLDSYAWVEYFLGSEAGKIVKEYLNIEEAVTPSIVLAEIARKYLREQIDEKEVVRRLEFVSANSIIAEIDVDLSVAAAKAYLEILEKAEREKLKKPGLTDGIVFAIGKTLGAKIITGDEHFKRLTEVIFIA